MNAVSTQVPVMLKYNEHKEYAYERTCFSYFLGDGEF